MATLSTFLIIACLQLEFVIHGTSARRVPLPLHEMPSVSDDSFTWQKSDGSYKFGMQGYDQWRVENRKANGETFVKFSYKTPDGQIHDSSFTNGRPTKTNAVTGRTQETPVEGKVVHKEDKYSSSEGLGDPEEGIPVKKASTPNPFKITSTESPKETTRYNFIKEKPNVANSNMNNLVLIPTSSPKKKIKLGLLDQYLKELNRNRIQASHFGISLNRHRKPATVLLTKSSRVSKLIKNSKNPQNSKNSPLVPHDKRESKRNTFFITLH